MHGDYDHSPTTSIISGPLCSMYLEKLQYLEIHAEHMMILPGIMIFVNRIINNTRTSGIQHTRCMCNIIPTNSAHYVDV